jgi:uncharacterized protein (DUF433 family)
VVIVELAAVTSPQQLTGAVAAAFGLARHAGRRAVPLRSLVEYLVSGERIDDFLEDFPTVTREDVIGVLELLTTKAVE